MNQTLKYISIIIICGVVFYVVASVKNWNKPNTQTASTITVPNDSGFVPVQHKEYQPPSIPILSKKRSGFKLPQGIDEKNIAKVTTVTLSKDDSLAKFDIIETNQGETFVSKDSSIKSVSVTTFTQPVFSFALSYGVGVSLSQNNDRFTFSPSACVSLMNWNISGIKFNAPVIDVDLNGLGAGIQTQLYHEAFIGLSHQWKYEGGQGYALTLHLQI